jgi:hypothetical protein
MQANKKNGERDPVEQRPIAWKLNVWAESVDSDVTKGRVCRLFVLPDCDTRVLTLGSEIQYSKWSEEAEDGWIMLPLGMDVLSLLMRPALPADHVVANDNRLASIMKMTQELVL